MVVSGVSSHEANHAEKKHKYNPMKTNYALIVVMILIKFGMTPMENNIVDDGNLENAVSGNQNVITQFLNWLSKVETSAGKTGLPKDFWSKGGKKQVVKMAQYLRKLFVSDPSLKASFPKYLTFDGKILMHDGKKVMNPVYAAITNGSKKMNGETLYEAFKYQREVDARDGKIYKNGKIDWHYNPKQDPTISALNALKTDLQGYSGGAFWKDLMVIGTPDEKKLDPEAFKAALGKPGSGVIGSFDVFAKNYYENSASTGKGAKPHNYLSEYYTAGTGSQAMLQSQTQQITTDVQQLSSQLSGEDNIGQQMIQAVTKSVGQMVQNLKTS